MKLRAASGEDAAAIAAIYAPFVTSSAVSFETEAPDAATMRQRIESGGDLHPWIVAEDGEGRVAGYAYSSAFRPRSAYRFTVETSVYLDSAFHRQGLGKRLYQSLLGTLKAQGFAQAIGAITLPNDGSVRLHEALGFVQAGVYRQVGYKMGRWHDVGLWQCALAEVQDAPAEPRPLSRQPLILV